MIRSILGAIIFLLPLPAFCQTVYSYQINPSYPSDPNKWYDTKFQACPAHAQSLAARLTLPGGFFRGVVEYAYINGSGFCVWWVAQVDINGVIWGGQGAPNGVIGFTRNVCNGSQVWDNSTQTCKSILSVQLTADAPVIPKNIFTVNKYVLTKSNLNAHVTENGQPKNRFSASLSSSRGAIDIIKNSTVVTDVTGSGKTEIKTRDQSSNSTVTANTQPAASTNITWLPARYESFFLVTCYITAIEKLYPTKPDEIAEGIPGKPRFGSKFLKDVRLNGSGILLNGKYIQYNPPNITKKISGSYNYDTCPRTKTQTCAMAGRTIAVERKAIPMGSSVTVDELGNRTAEDVGQAINGYHIDDYLGEVPASQCYALGKRYLGITFLNY